jgi:hypothetical protein
MNRAAVEAWRRRQHQLLSDTYDEAWERGVDSYQPGPDTNHAAVPVGLGAAAATLAARRAQPYVAPKLPVTDDEHLVARSGGTLRTGTVEHPVRDAVVKTVALGAAVAGVNRMADEILNLSPASDHVAIASAMVAAGELDRAQEAAHALELAVTDYLDRNAWRLDAGESAAWAGEQSGFAEAAASNGELLEWVTEEDDSVCQDCEDLGNLPPMPFEDWPTQPGHGDTDCNVGCRCTFDAVPGEDLPELHPVDNAVIERISAARGAELATA